MLEEPHWPLQGAEAELPNQLSHLASAIRGSEKSMGTQDTTAGRVGLLFTIRTMRNLDALAILCRDGYAPEAAGIVRAILEDAVSLAYLADDADNRAEQWATFAEERTKRAAEQQGPPSGSPWWAGLSPAKMAAKLQGHHKQIGEEFSTVYWRLCDDTHGSPISARHHVVPPNTPDALPAMLVGPSSHRVGELSALGAVAATRVCHVAAELGVDLDMDAVTDAAAVPMRHFLNSGGKLL